jgi:hypothetical protein
MITAHLTVSIESRTQQNTIEDLAGCLETLAATLREIGAPLSSPASDTIIYGKSEINYTLVQFPKAP